MNDGNKPIPSHALKGDSSLGCDPSTRGSGSGAAGSSGVIPGNYGFVYVSPEVVRKLSSYYSGDWNKVGAISLIVGASGEQFFQFCTDDFRRLELVALRSVMGGGPSDEDLLS